MHHRLGFRVFVLSVLLGCGSMAHAQFEQQNRVTSYLNRGGYRTAAAAILSRPTVSPYLALTDLTGTGQIDTSRNYFTQVRPQLENERLQQQNQRSLMQVQQQVTALRSATARQSQARIRGTGHPTRFNYLMHYYPGLLRR